MNYAPRYEEVSLSVDSNYLNERDRYGESFRGLPDRRPTLELTMTFDTLEAAQSFYEHIKHKMDSQR